MGGCFGNGLGLFGSCGCSASPVWTCLQVDVVLQSECLMGDLVLVVPQLKHLLVGWVLEVVQLVFHTADLEYEVGNLLLNLLSLSLLLQLLYLTSYWYSYLYLHLYLLPVFSVQILF